MFVNIRQKDRLFLKSWHNIITDNFFCEFREGYPLIGIGGKIFALAI
jgi:hypothetical protein